jgi:hypothetical protein
VLLAVVAATMGLALLLPVSVASATPTMPPSVTATRAANPVVALITWGASTDASGVAGYRVWSSTLLAGPWELLGTVTAPLSFNDTHGVPGQPYFYAVSARDPSGNESTRSVAAASVTATWTRSPHVAYAGTFRCERCHSVHVAATYHNLLRYTGDTPAEMATCYACHDGSGASTNMKWGATNSFLATTTLPSGHVLEGTDSTATADLTDVCSDCHSPHIDRPSQWRSRVNTTTVNNVTGANNTWCLACHNDAQDWYTTKYHSSYPTITAPARDASGYPVFGTFPGATVYNDSAKNRHALIPAQSAPTTRVAGDCLYCHASHRGPSKYDDLRAEFRPTTASTLATDRVNGVYAASCFAAPAWSGPSTSSGMPRTWAPTTRRTRATASSPSPRPCRSTHPSRATSATTRTGRPAETRCCSPTFSE